MNGMRTTRNRRLQLGRPTNRTKRKRQRAFEKAINVILVVVSPDTRRVFSTEAIMRLFPPLVRDYVETGLGRLDEIGLILGIRVTMTIVANGPFIERVRSRSIAAVSGDNATKRSVRWLRAVDCSSITKTGELLRSGQERLQGLLVTESGYFEI